MDRLQTCMANAAIVPATHAPTTVVVLVPASGHLSHVHHHARRAYHAAPPQSTTTATTGRAATTHIAAALSELVAARHHSNHPSRESRLHSAGRWLARKLHHKPNPPDTTPTIPIITPSSVPPPPLAAAQTSQRTMPASSPPHPQSPTFEASGDPPAPTTPTPGRSSPPAPSFTVTPPPSAGSPSSSPTAVTNVQAFYATIPPPDPVRTPVALPPLCHLQVDNHSCAGPGEPLLVNVSSPIAADKPRVSEQLCAICQDTFAGGDCLMRLECLHEYHQDCISSFVTSSKDPFCPCCRYPVHTKLQYLPIRTL